MKTISSMISSVPGIRPVNNFSRVMVRLLIAACLSTAAVPAMAIKPYEVLQNGRVQFGQRSFNSFSDYSRSPEFRAEGMRCGLDVAAERRGPEIAQRTQSRQFKSTADCTASLTQIMPEYDPAASYVLNVWVHVIHKTDGTGDIGDGLIQAQIDALNEDYRATPATLGENGHDVKVEFQLAGITRTENDAWYADSEAAETEYKNALAVDPSKFINIYTNDAAGLLGYAYFPFGAAGAWFDGLVINHEVFGGRDTPGAGFYDQGRTVVHEIGHYLGLNHTFDGGLACSNTYSSGDLIVDTDAQSEAQYGCPASPANSCGTVGPIDNYMNYVDDDCMTEFTPEQGNRMVCSLVNYRADLLQVDSDGDGVPDTEDDFPEDPTENTDSDGDGVGDNADDLPFDPTETVDTDDDGLGDNKEGELGTDPTKPDTDGDGFTDKEEFDAGTDPLDVNDAPVLSGGLGIAVITAALGSRSTVNYAVDSGVGLGGIECSGDGGLYNLEWANQFNTVAGGESITEVLVAFGDAPGGTSAAGSAVQVRVYDDPNNDGQPGDLVLLQTANGAIANYQSDVFNSFAISPTAVTGSFFVAVSADVPDNSFPARYDNAVSAGQSWVRGDCGSAWSNITVITDSNFMVRAKATQ